MSGRDDELPVDLGELVDYSAGGFDQPGLAAPVQYRPHPRHDRQAWASMQRAAANSGEDEDMTWDEIQARASDPDDDRKVVFYPPESVSNPFYPARDERVIVDHAANGDLYRARPTVIGPGRGHLFDRHGNHVSH